MASTRAFTQSAETGEANTFELVALEWLELHRNKFASATFEKAEWTVKDLVNPFIASRPITEIGAPELLAVFRL